MHFICVKAHVKIPGNQAVHDMVDVGCLRDDSPVVNENEFRPVWKALPANNRAVERCT